MLILLSKISNAPIIDLENQKKVASLSDVVIDPNSGKILGLIVKVGQLLPKDQLVSTDDIVQMLPTSILINDYDAITNISEVIRVQELYKKRFALIKKPVRTKGGQYIGRVNDLLFTDNTFSLAKIYVRHLLSDRIIPYSAIIKIEDKAIIVKDDYEAVSATEKSELPAQAELA